MSYLSINRKLSVILIVLIVFLDIKFIISVVMQFCGQTVDSIDETTRESSLVKQSVIRTKKVVSLMTDRAVMIDLTFQVNVSVISVVSSLAIEVILRNRNEKRIFREIRSFQFIRKVGIRRIVYYPSI